MALVLRVPLLLLALTVACTKSSARAPDNDAAGLTSMMPRVVRLDLPVKFENATFVRYALGDREVILRRGAEAKKTQYGFELAKRVVPAHGESFTVVTYQDILSPPPLDPKNPRTVDGSTYKPKHDVIYAYDAEILVPYAEGSNEIVDRVLAALRLE